MPEDDYGYKHYLGRYLTGSTDFNTCIINGTDDLQQLEGSDYIFVMDSENTILNSWILENYPNQYGNTVIRPDLS